MGAAEVDELRKKPDHFTLEKENWYNEAIFLGYKVIHNFHLDISKIQTQFISAKTERHNQIPGSFLPNSLISTTILLRTHMQDIETNQFKTKRQKKINSNSDS